VAQVAEAVRRLAERAHVVSEGAGAAPLAAAFAGALNGVRGRPLDAARVVCVVSGGNVDASVLASILRGNVP
jgi:threonine dehydratase